MGLTKSRVKEVKIVGGEVSVVIQQSEYTPAQTVSVWDLKRHELFRVARMVGAKPPAGEKWTAVDTMDVIAAIEAKAAKSNHIEVMKVVGDAPNPIKTETAEQETADQPSPEDEGTAPDLELKPTDSVEELLEKIRQRREASASVKGESDEGKAGEVDGQAGAEAESDADGNEGEGEGQEGESEGEGKGDEGSDGDEENETAAKGESDESESGEGEEGEGGDEEAEPEPEPEPEPNLPDPFQRTGRDRSVLEKIMDGVNAGQHIYLAGPPGSGKSYLTEIVAAKMGREWYSISFGPQTPESRLWGHMGPDHDYRPTAWRHAVEGGVDGNGAIFCGDEIDNGHSGIQVTMNQTLAGTRVTFPDQVVDVSPDFTCIVTANTWGRGANTEFMGRNQLDAAFLDRFLQIEVPYDRKLEKKLVFEMADEAGLDRQTAMQWVKVTKIVRANAESHKIKAVVSMRTSFAGVGLLAAGWTFREILDVKVLAGLPDARIQHLLMDTGVPV
jgi:cobaltochelatase CobS